MTNNTDWWKKAVVYQIYPRSFCDSNGDGIGDINGITSKLGYLKELGVDVIWISPVYQSPMRDNGYDISDYRAINPEFGTMEDFDNLLEKAHGLGLKIVMDLVVNHSSDEHPWFKESRSSLDSPKRDYYIWRKPAVQFDGRYSQASDEKNVEPPNDWNAWFGGPAWNYDETTGQYYLALFSPWQPDLNWENPIVRAEVYDLMRFWLNKGIDGFRMDVISFISKPLDERGELIFPKGDAREIIPNGPRVHEYLQEMRREVLSQYDIMTVGETGGVTVDEAVKYANADGSELNMVFHFEHVGLDGDQDFKWNDRKIILTDLKEVLSRWQTKLYGKAWNSLYWCNHDQPRIVSRLGDENENREKSAKMLAACLHFMQGTPYIYQGEELGMTNAPFADISDFRDLESINAYHALVTDSKYFSKDEMLRYMRHKSRDNSRTPMQWNDGQNAGFCTYELPDGAEYKPWIMLNPNYREINAEEQINRDGSVFKFYQMLIHLRKTMDIITYGEYELLLPDHSDLFVYTRSYRNKKLLVVCNFSSEERVFILPEGFNGKNILITNEDADRTYTTEINSQGYKQKASVTLGPYGAIVYQK